MIFSEVESAILEGGVECYELGFIHLIGCVSMCVVGGVAQQYSCVLDVYEYGGCK